ncbi:D-lactate dehydrogenase [cytochrome], mitochondrial-like [Pistacia vera]|uniref:D-lactate dehydrogenase [cytochrome], mitochondrial-like n=1 Tax=Pistacia vera TaxID=55513 RepID=UPI0012639620|nr:D-lactate dehydrogenase [cytochrome], mitochondrial-like [Pistacia vera]
MGFSVWFSRLRSSSSSYSSFSNLRASRNVRTLLTSNTGNTSSGGGSSRTKQPFLLFSSSLIPLAVSVSDIQSQSSSPSLCDSSTYDYRGVSIGGKGSTEYEVKGSHKEVSQEFIDELKAICQDNVTLDYDERYFHGKPQNSFHKAVNIPDIVVFPRSEEEVSKIVKCCDKHRIPIVPYGGATSIEGHTLSPLGGVCIDMSMMKSVKALHIEDMDVVVEPGIGWMELNEYLEPYGLFFPLDPGPGATIGGMCATRCSGSLAVRYGTMRDNVINLRVVLANGDIVKTASRARKSAAGYDLTRLIIGSEGTLGVITEVTLRLQKIPQHSVVAMCNFPTIKDAADVAIATMLTGIQVSRVELLDEVQVKAVNIANGKNLPELPTLMFELIGTEAYSREQTLIVQKIVSEHNGSDFVFAEEPEAKKELWKIRKEALWACFAMEPNFEAMISVSQLYGTMRDNVINLRVVLANGDIVKTASRARKSAAGCEPYKTCVAMCNFPTIKDAADVAIATMLTGIQVSRVELLDEVQVKAVNIANGKNLPELPTLMFELIGTGDEIPLSLYSFC